MYPYERSLVKKMEGKPFVLLGVNTDEDREELQAVMQRQQITWRSWFDGSTGGPICKEWRVRAFPTIHLIDHRGMVRYMQVRESQIENLLEELIAEAEKEKS
jgi:hypothetical protein